MIAGHSFRNTLWQWPFLSLDVWPLPNKTTGHPEAIPEISTWVRKEADHKVFMQSLFAGTMSFNFWRVQAINLVRGFER